VSAISWRGRIIFDDDHDDDVSFVLDSHAELANFVYGASGYAYISTRKHYHDFEQTKLLFLLFNAQCLKGKQQFPFLEKLDGRSLN
jgi:hypothetical protein